VVPVKLLVPMRRLFLRSSWSLLLRRINTARCAMSAAL
jgi:hypothetical protein